MRLDRLHFIKQIGLNERIAEVILSNRLAQGLCLTEVAEKLSITSKQLLAWETAIDFPRCDQLYGLMRILGPDAEDEAAFILSEVQWELYSESLKKSAAEVPSTPF